MTKAPSAASEAEGEDHGQGQGQVADQGADEGGQDRHAVLRQSGLHQLADEQRQQLNGHDGDGGADPQAKDGTAPVVCQPDGQCGQHDGDHHRDHGDQVEVSDELAHRFQPRHANQRDLAEVGREVDAKPLGDALANDVPFTEVRWIGELHVIGNDPGVLESFETDDDHRQYADAELAIRAVEDRVAPEHGDNRGVRDPVGCGPCVGEYIGPHESGDLLGDPVSEQRLHQEWDVELSDDLIRQPAANRLGDVRISRGTTDNRDVAIRVQSDLVHP